MATNKLYIRDFTLFVDGQSDYAIPELLNSDSSLEITPKVAGIIATVVDHAAGKISLSPNDAFTDVEFWAGQDVQWPDLGGVAQPTDHPISKTEVDAALAGAQQAETNKLEIEQINARAYTDSEGAYASDASGTFYVQFRNDAGEKQERVGIPLGDYVQKEAGKGLSTNDLTDSLKTKLEGLDSPLAKGYHDTLALLQAAAPSPVVNTYGFVKDANGDYELHVYDGFAWVNKGVVGGGTPTGSALKSLLEAEANTNFMTDTEQSKLAGIETGAEKNVLSLANVEKAGSSLDFELTDGTTKQINLESAIKAVYSEQYLKALARAEAQALQDGETPALDPIDFSSVEEKTFSAGEWLSIDPHFRFYITKDLEKFNLGYTQGNTNYPTAVFLDYDIRCHFGKGKNRHHQSIGLFGGAVGIPLPKDKYEQLYFYKDGDTFIFSNNVELQETDDWMEATVYLKFSEFTKVYRFQIHVVRGGDGDTKNKFQITGVSASGYSLSTDKSKYNK